MRGSKLRAAGVKGIGAYLPERILTNADLEKLVETSDQWILERTGIRERRIASKDETAATLGTRAAIEAIKDAGINPTDVQCIITATITPDYFFPATACLIQDAIGATGAAAFDLLVGCTGFVYGLVIASQMVSYGAFDNVLVIGADVLSKFINWRDRHTCVLFGDGAGAAVISQIDDDYGLLGFDIGSDGSLSKLLRIEAGGSHRPASLMTVLEEAHSLTMNGSEVFKFAVRAMSDSTRRALQACGLDVEHVSLFVPHQANMRIVRAAAERLQIPIERIFTNVEKYGNTSAASIPIALAEADKLGRIKRGDIVVCTSFGGGLSWASCVLRW
ncbi:MAG: beta-ketoacyl-ACP synthase III [Armatimonadota bacterium]|nr:ketoacyl-ACP synthase III [Armatimonadota bacterium]MCX7777636.1 ketoacyl-ACP synthase III [Armatimonadota bacterium]MDW8025882.1 beta-ketoacyl-ACP synthase III [Armatimonadota bacterium]